MHDLARNGISGAKKLNDAAQQQGATSGAISAHSKLGARGGQVSHLERDFHALVRKILQIPDILYRTKIAIRHPLVGRPQDCDIAFLLPHALMGILGEVNPDLFSRVAGLVSLAKF